jgi:GNAT superfamily N-acetyltransferase
VSDECGRVVINVPEARIVSARAESLDRINRLIARSKSYWAWPNGYLEQALPLHRVTPAYLRANRCFEALDRSDVLLAFASVLESDDRVIIDNLWVAPEHIRCGIGKAMCEHLFRLARQTGWPQLWVLPDPPAEGFYFRMGFSHTGERVPSRIAGGPVFSVLSIAVRTPI